MKIGNTHIRIQSPDIKKRINGKLIILEREDIFLQNKSQLYYIMRKIEKGKIDLIIPDDAKGDVLFRFIAKLDKTLKFIKY